jgi:hypothetical protein
MDVYYQNDEIREKIEEFQKRKNEYTTKMTSLII